MTELSLFSGAGGGLLGTKLLGFQCVGYVEKDPYCQRVLRARIRDGFLDDAPIFGDVRAFDGLPYRGRVDCVTAGFPCQPFSVAGKRKGSDDERNMWPDTIRIIREVQPRFALLENVPGLITSGYFGTILGDLAAAGFDAEWDCVSAEDVGAPHRRKRLWIVADATRARVRRLPARSRREGEGATDFDGCGETVADALCNRLQGGEPIEPSVVRRRSSDSRKKVADATGLQLRQEPHAGTHATRYPSSGAVSGQGSLLADADQQHGNDGRHGASKVRRKQRQSTELRGSEGQVAHSDFLRRNRRAGQFWPGRRGEPANRGWWDAEPNVGGSSHGLAERMDRPSAVRRKRVSGVDGGE